MFLGIEIGGTKLQVGVGPNDGRLTGLWRGTVDVARGGEGIREQLVRAVPELLQSANISRDQVRGLGIGFGGPVDDHTQSVIKSHQIQGWDDFPLGAWLGEALKLPTVLGNDADVAGLAEGTVGAGKGMSPVFYMTLGSGIGGGLLIDGRIARGTGRGAAEIGHLRVPDPQRNDGRLDVLENIASGWGIVNRVKQTAKSEPAMAARLIQIAGSAETITGQTVAKAAQEGDPLAVLTLNGVTDAISDAICAAIVLVCPQRFVIGGGVSLMGEELIFEPIRRKVAEKVFKPFAGLTDIVPAALGEEVVVHGAIALAASRFGGKA
ncbi:ROK family protein [Zavarzinella formosa]|uniref:ROK family protein n=1 Tax=Zavarzinella formosa TaxID=360055 RepID=UPI0012FA5117|nr:ROK family protein [Zavarzinella formosa]